MKSKSYHTNDIFDARPGILDILKCEADWSYVRNNIVQLTIVQLTAHYIGRSSYLLDATNPNRLWFHQFRERNWLSLNGLLRQSIEQFAA
jgi:hypothetical protein